MRRLHRSTTIGAAVASLILAALVGTAGAAEDAPDTQPPARKKGPSEVRGPAASVNAMRSGRLNCGDMITRSTTLTADVGPCPGDGIIIGADNIMLNLNGHTISGTPGPGDGNAAGVRLMNKSGVKVTGQPGASERKGTVTGFDAGIAVYRGSGNTIEALVARDNVGPASDQAELGDGIALFNSADNRIINNSVLRNGTYDGITALGPGSDNNLVQGNLVEGSIGFGGCCNPGSGIIFSNFFQPDDPRRGESIIGNRITDNVVRTSYTAGISAISYVRGQIIGNLVEDNGRFWQQRNNGIGLSRGDMSVLASETLIQGNRVFRSGMVGIQLDRGVQATTINENEVRDNAVMGILAGPNTRNNFILSNTSLGNGLDDLNDAGDGEDWENSTCPNIWRNNIYVYGWPRCVTEQNPPATG